MGFFTYRQTKKTKQELEKLRAQQQTTAKAQAVEQRRLAQQDRETGLFQQLPSEGKEEFRAAQDDFRAKLATFSPRKQRGNSKDVRNLRAEFATSKTQIFRKYDLIP